MSIPYIGFRGDFGNLSTLEKPIYDSKDGSSYYHEANSDAKDQLDGDGLQFYALKNNFTALTTESNPWTIIKAVKEGVENIEDIESSEITETILQVLLQNKTMIVTTISTVTLMASHMLRSLQMGTVTEIMSNSKVLSCVMLKTLWLKSWTKKEMLFGQVR